MWGMESAAGILSGVSVALSLLSIWLCQMTQRRVDRVSSDAVTDALLLRDELKAERKRREREIQTLRREAVGRAHYLESKARDSLH